MSITERAGREDAAGAASAGRILVMFDVDGTLTESCALDAAVYLDALRDVFGFEGVSDDWAAYRYATDAGILDELFHAHRGRGPTEDEAARMQARFLELASTRMAEAGGLRPVAGAGKILARLFASPDHAVAYASGGWRASALGKLRSAGLPTESMPGAFSDDGLSREEICRASRQRAEAHHACTFARVVYIGDGVWDMRTSQNLGYGFVGIGNGAGADRLRAEGAACVLADFRDAAAFLKGVAAARTPIVAD